MLFGDNTDDVTIVYPNGTVIQLCTYTNRSTNEAQQLGVNSGITNHLKCIRNGIQQHGLLKQLITCVAGKPKLRRYQDLNVISLRIVHQLHD